MNLVRIIPRLDIKGPNLVKGIHLEGLRVLGKPEDFAYRYYEDGADELIYMDIVASLYGRNNILEIVSRTAAKIFIPLTVGGGIRTIDDIKSALRAGADKVAINTAAIQNPSLIAEGAKKFGSQCIVVSIEARKKGNDRYEAYTDNGRERTGVDVFDWAVEVYKMGAGELIITCVDTEGTCKGYDLELVKKIAESVPIPVIACGGAGTKQHILSVIKKGKADAVCAASVFHYNCLEDTVKLEEFKDEGNVEYLKKYSETKKPFKARELELFSIKELKAFLLENNVQCRMSV